MLFSISAGIFSIEIGSWHDTIEIQSWVEGDILLLGFELSSELEAD
jgi:hypothetical protein